MSLRVNFDAGTVVKQLTSLRGATRAIMLGSMRKTACDIDVV